MREIQFRVYSYDELSSEAQDRAIDLLSLSFIEHGGICSEAYRTLCQNRQLLVGIARISSYEFLSDGRLWDRSLERSKST